MSLVNWVRFVKPGLHVIRGHFVGGLLGPGFNIVSILASLIADAFVSARLGLLRFRR